MAISVFPTPVASSINANSITATSANTLYQGLVSLDPAIYTITCATSTVAKIEFYSGAGTFITNAVTSSGTVTINLASSADRVRLWTDTGSNIVVTITKTASALTSNFSGTLDTVTATGTYTGTSTSGFGYAVLIGGGGSGMVGYGGGGGGGGGGAIVEKVVALTGSMSVTIGAGATGYTTAAGDVYAPGGGSSAFAGMTAGGGSGAAGSSGDGGPGGSASGGTYNTTGTTGSNRNNGIGGAGASVIVPNYKFVASQPGTGGAGGATANAVGAAGTGYGSGGGGGGGQYAPSGGGNFAGNAGGGRPGVLYVLRF
jgi:hypothetical protein